MLRSPALELGAKEIRNDPQPQTFSLLCLHPCGVRANLRFSAAKTSKSLKKLRAARAMEPTNARAMEPTNDTQNRDPVPDKIEIQSLTTRSYLKVKAPPK